MTSEVKTKGKPNEMDVHVGQRLRVQRVLFGLSQEKLAEAIGITFQQIQKYECGKNRISAGRLFDISKILDVPVSYFFEHFGRFPSSAHVAQGLLDNDQDEDIMSSKETLNLVSAYYSIEDLEARKDILKIIKSFSKKNV